MRFESVAIEGFGKLVNQRFEFSPGLNLIVGPNEAGKSTLQLALLCMLYGILPEGTVNAEARAVRDRLKPWAGTNRFGGQLVYRLQDGHAFRIQRTFSSRGMSTTLVSLPDGRDISQQFDSSSNGRLFFAERQFGVSKDVFEHTCFVHQSELVALERSASAITDRLMQISASAASDTTVVEALAALQTASREEVGTDRSWTKPLAQARGVVEALKTEREVAAEAHERLLTLYAERWASLQDLDQAHEQRDRLRYLALVARSIELREQQAKLTETGREVQHWAEEVERLRAWASFPVERRDEVVTLADRLQGLARTIERLREGGEGARKGLETVTVERNALEAEAAGFADVRALNTAALAEVDRLWSRLTLLAETAKRDEKALAEAERECAELHRSVDERKQQLAPALRLGVPGIVSLRQHLASAADEATWAQRAVEEAEREWRTLAGGRRVPSWATYPADRADDVTALARRLQEGERALQKAEGPAAKAETALGRLRDERAAIGRRLAAQRFPQNAESAIAQAHTLVAEWRAQLDRQELLEKQWQQVQAHLTDSNFELGRERAELHRALDLGMGGIASLRQRWSDVNRRLGAAEERRSGAEAEWARVGMDETRFRQLEKTVRAYRAGTGPAPAARRGCLSFLSAGKPSGPPTDVKISDDIQPIDARLTDARAVSDAAREERELLLREIHAALGSLLGGPPSEAGFAHLQRRVEAVLVWQRSADEQQKGRDALANELRRVRRAVADALDRASESLTQLDIVAADPSSALTQLTVLRQASAQSKDHEARLRELQLQSEGFQRDVEAYRSARGAHEQARSELEGILRAASFDGGSIDDGIAAFRAGMRAHECWNQHQAAQQEQSTSREAAERTLGTLLGGDLSEDAFQQLQTEMEALASSEATLSARAKTLDDLRRQYTDLTGQITEVEKELRRTLRSVGIVEDDLARDVETYREQCERIETLGELDRRVEGVRVREAGLRRDLEEYENHVALLQSAQQGLHTILEESGIHAPDVRDGVEEYHRRARLHGQWVEATEKLERATQMHAVYVGCDPETDLDARVQVLESERAAAATVHPEWADLSIDESGETYGERAREARDAAQDIERRIGDIDEEMQRLAVEHRELAAIDEDIAVSEARVNDLVQLRTDLDEAREHLEMAMRDFQKQFAPQLQLWMGEGLERLTRGRYREVTIDPVTLATSVTAPELGTTVPIDHLSSGTRDAAYLTLRVAIARFMSRSGEPLPLLLDDPFVRLDRERIAWALRYLLTLTEDTQILLFTKDDQIAAWYERLAGAPNQHIHRLSRAVAAV